MRETSDRRRSVVSLVSIVVLNTRTLASPRKIIKTVLTKDNGNVPSDNSRRNAHTKPLRPDWCALLSPSGLRPPPNPDHTFHMVSQFQDMAAIIKQSEALKARAP